MPVVGAAVFDCLVFSGGGAKGAYGAGAAKALAAYRELKKVDHGTCYLGASAGALNAAVLAMSDADRLVEFWRNATNRSILGVRVKNARYQGGKRWLGGLGRKRSFSVYTSKALLRLIQQSTSFDALEGKHLVVAVTDYTEGALKAFYHSSLITRFIDRDREVEQRQRRLQHFLPLTRENLVHALLASSSIPVAFPPVEIGGSWYVDGGLGNNTPTREAAYFLRYLAELRAGEPGEMFVVRLEPPRLRRAGPMQDTLLDVVDRSLSIYHHVHTSPIIRAWGRINDEVRWHEQRLEEFIKWLGGQELPPGLAEAIATRLRDDLGRLGGATARRDIPIYVIEPAAHLGDTLDFKRHSIERNLTTGYQDALRVLHLSQKLDQAEHEMLLNQPI
jgi:predicted acylesterase/phospholipase RssA